MPAPPVQPGVVRISLKHTWGTDLDIVDRFYISYTGTPPTNAQLVTFCTAVAAAWVTDFAPMAAGDVTLVEVDAVDLTSSTAAVGTATVSDSGSRGGNPNPAGTAALISFKIARRYRGGKPRIYLPYGTASDLLTPQTWTASFVTAMNSAWNAFIVAVKAAAWAGGTITNQVSISQYSGFTTYTGAGGRMHNRSTPRATAITPDIVTGVSTSQRFASQRRRNRP